MRHGHTYLIPHLRKKDLLFDVPKQHLAHFCSVLFFSQKIRQKLIITLALCLHKTIHWINLICQTTKTTHKILSAFLKFFYEIKTTWVVLTGIRTIALEENCPQVRIRVWVRVTVSSRVEGRGNFPPGQLS